MHRDGLKCRNRRVEVSLIQSRESIYLDDFQQEVKRIGCKKELDRAFFSFTGCHGDKYRKEKNQGKKQANQKKAFVASVAYLDAFLLIFHMLCFSIGDLAYIKIVRLYRLHFTAKRVVMYGLYSLHKKIVGCTVYI